MTKSLLLVTLLLSQFVFSQTKISEIKKTERFICIWGLLKYQHPEVSKGTFDMNLEFITEFDKIRQLETEEQLNSELLLWIKKFDLGKSRFKTNPDRIKGKNIFTKNADFTWIDNSGFSTEIIVLLKEIQDNSNIGEHYARSNSMSTMVAFENEKGLDNFDVTKKSHRILFLSSYWNIIKYWNPNLYLTDTPWSKVLSEMIPDFLESDAVQFEYAKEKLFSKLNDSHGDYTFSYSLQKKLTYFAPVGGRIVNDSMVITRLFNKELAKKSTLGLGDVIVSIEGKNVKDYYTDKFFNTISVSNKNYLKSAIQNTFLLAGSESDSIPIGIIRKDGSTATVFLKRYPLTEFKNNGLYESMEKPRSGNWSKLNNDIGYINLLTVNKSELKQAFDEFKNTKGIIIDLRNYPRNISEDDIANFLYPEKKVFIKILGAAFPAYGKYDIDAPLKLIKNPFAAGGNNKNYYKGKIVLLVNGFTGSKAEFIGMAIQQAPNCITMGEQTFGAVMNRNKITLIDKTTIDFTGEGAFYPDDTNVQRNGLKIDHVVQESAIHYNPNLYLEKAIEIIGQ